MAKLNATLKRALLDSYIKAIRWASDRIGDSGGIIGFVHNASMLDERSTQGLRRCLVEEFDAIYSFHLRGNQRTKGELARKEGGKIFGQNSRTPVAISFLVKGPRRLTKEAEIYYHDIGDYLSREQKLQKISAYSSITNINWQTITPDKHGDWLDQRDSDYEQLPVLGDKKRGGGIFALYSCGVKTNRDGWAYNYDHSMVAANMAEMIGVYNCERDRLAGEQLNVKNIDQHIELNEKKIKWSRSLKQSLIKGKEATFTSDKIKLSSYRPFIKKHLYYCTMFNELHIGYEQQPQLAGVKILYRGQETRLERIPPASLLVTKMKIAKDQQSIKYNDDITVTGIPAETWQYQVSGYAPVKWIVERYYRKIDPKTDLLDDPNNYSDDAPYILRLLLSTITVAVETVCLIEKLRGKET